MLVKYITLYGCKSKIRAINMRKKGDGHDLCQQYVPNNWISVLYRYMGKCKV